MKKVLAVIICLMLIQIGFSQTGCKLTKEKPWIVLDGQMVNNVYPPRPGVSFYVISIKGDDADKIELIKTEEMATLSKTETINGLQRWLVSFKSKMSRKITTVIFKCGCEVYVRVLEQPVILWNTISDNQSKN
jgi:hypothetical protein